MKPLWHFADRLQSLEQGFFEQSLSAEAAVLDSGQHGGGQPMIRDKLIKEYPMIKPALVGAHIGKIRHSGFIRLIDLKLPVK